MHLAATAPTDLDAVGLGGTYTVALAQEVYAGKPDWDPSVDTAVVSKLFEYFENLFNPGLEI